MWLPSKVNGVQKLATRLTATGWDHRVTCHPAELTFLPLPQPRLVLDLATSAGSVHILAVILLIVHTLVFIMINL